jgi:hypothetical protein
MVVAGVRWVLMLRVPRMLASVLGVTRMRASVPGVTWMWWSMPGALRMWVTRASVSTPGTARV